jgi:hypothetical protein
LTVEVEKTRRAYYACVDQIHEALGEIATLPHRDGVMINRNVGQSYRKALREYTDAMIRLNRYLLDSPIENERGERACAVSR